MGFHIAMIACAVLLPVTMIVLGALFTLSPPQRNSLFGYRTSMSTKNDVTWNFAHRFAGRLWLAFGILSTPPTIIVMVILPNGTEESISLITTIVMLAQLSLMIVSCIATEIALHRRFDKNGIPK